MPKVDELALDGSPGILLPRAALERWRGMYLPAPYGVEAEVVVDNKSYVRDDAMAEDDPRTDYDRISAGGAAVRVAQVGDWEALVMFGEGARWTYLEDMQALISNPDASSILQLGSIASNRWRGFETLEEAYWNVDPDSVFFDSAEHGGMLKPPHDEPHLGVGLVPGKYRVAYGKVGVAQVFLFRASER